MDTTSDLFHRLAQHYLSVNLYDSARFYAERSYYEKPSQLSLYLVALCFYREGKYKQAFLILEDAQYLPSKYLFALSAFALQRFEESERALLPISSFSPRDLSNEKISQIPGGAYGLYLLGMICRRQNRREYAIQYFRWTLKADPFCWSAHTALAEMGEIYSLKELHGMDIKAAITNLGELDKTSHFNEQLPNEDFQILEKKIPSNLERKKIIEKSIDETSFRASASLGTASSFIHQPFASPASMPPPTPSYTSTRLQHSYIQTHEVDNGLHPPFSPFTGPHQPAQLHFDFDSPGFTPIPSHDNMLSTIRKQDDRNEYSIHPQYHSVDISSIHVNYKLNFHMGGGTDPQSLPHYDRDHHLNHSNIDESNSIITSDVISSIPQIHRHNLRHHHDSSSQRRVSFDPSARLSFSGMGTESYVDQMDDPASTPVSEITNKFNDTESNLKGTGTESEELTHPQKIRRRSASTRNSVSRVRSPKSTTTTTSTTAAAAPSTIINTRSSNSRLSTGGMNPDKGSSTIMTTASTERSRTKSQKAAGGSTVTEPGSTSVTTRRSLGKSTEQTQTHANSAHVKSHRDGGQETAASSLKQRNQQQPQSNKIKIPSEALPVPATSSTAVMSTSPSDHMKAVTSLLTVMTRAIQLQQTYRCEECISLINKLPKRHFHSGWAQELIGRALFERAEYSSAVITLKEMLRLEPYRIKGVETLSTALWHLKKEKELCALAQRVVDVDKFSPEVWCVTGNCFSLQKEHETALKFFERALQIDPHYAYAHTLTGHEHVLNEDLEKASTSFRSALRIDERHYNAWYGLGFVYYRQERYELAEFHFRKAVDINRSSSVLQCYLGMVLLARDCIPDALEVLDMACVRDKRNPQLQFQRATALNALHQYAAAREALLLVRDMVPREPPVYAMLGQICLRLGRKKEALKHLDMAVMLDSKEAALLKAALTASAEDEEDSSDQFENY